MKLKKQILNMTNMRTWDKDKEKSIKKNNNT